MCKTSHILTQPPHHDRQEEPEETRDCWRQYTGDDSEGRRRRCCPRFKERNIDCQLWQVNKSLSGFVENEHEKHTEFKLAKIDMTNRGTVLKKQTTDSSRNPMVLFRMIVPCDLFMLAQIWRDGRYLVILRDKEHVRCPWDLEPRQSWSLLDAFLPVTWPRCAHMVRRPSMQSHSSQLYGYQSETDSSRWQLLCASILHLTNDCN